MNPRKLRNILVLGLGSMFLVFGFQNCGNDVEFSAQSKSEALLSSNFPLDAFLSDDDVLDKLALHSQDLLIVAEKPKVDILFVVDNSGSMANIQKNISDRIKGFMDQISDLDYQIAVTTTDPRANSRDADNKAVPWGDGQFRPFSKGNEEWFVMRPGDFETPEQAQESLGNSIRMGIRGSGDERGVHVTYRAIERRQTNPENDEFFRPGAALSVILISDEDECSNAECLATKPTSRPEELLSLVDQELGKDKVFSFNSILLPEQRCPGAHKEARVGTVYLQLSELTGGVVGDICEDDYTNQLSIIGLASKSLVNSVRLGCVPQVPQSGSIGKVAILRNGSPISLPFSLSGDRLVLESELSPGDYSFLYYCEEE
jgi:hypothetical protein